MLSRVVEQRGTATDCAALERIRMLEEQVRVSEDARKRAENEARRLLEEREQLAEWKVNAEGKLRELGKQVEDTALSNHQLREALKKAEENLTNVEAAEEVAHEGLAALAELQTLLEGLGAPRSTLEPNAKATF